ncbi:MAG: HpcH/HpaI aldolase family protein [Bradyrhizobium sp.]
MTHRNARPFPADFRKRLAGGERLIGTFIKTPTSHTSEIIGDVGYDFVVIDEEHAPFDRAATDQALLGARAAGTAGFVRVPDSSRILGALDDGAIGVMAPHIDEAEKAKELVSYARYKPGRRGFSNSPRAGRYGGKDFQTHIADGDARTTVVAMIEDARAVETIDGIVTVEGLDAIFIGRSDLTLSLGAGAPGEAVVQQAVERICSAALKVGMPVWVPAINASERDAYVRLGANVFVVATDQAFMRRAAAASLKELRG